MKPQRLLHEALELRAARPGFSHKVAVLVEGKPHTYGELLDQSLRLSAALRARGLVRGDRVAIYMDNTWPCIVSLYATLLAGGVFSIVNPQTKADKLEFILNDSGARILLTDGHLSKEFLPALPLVRQPLKVIASGQLPAGASIEAFDEVVDATPPGLPTREIIPLDLAALIYTSGSTGNPKGVMQTHQSMVFAAGSLIEYLRLSDEDRILCVLPLAFDYGLYQLLMTIQLGATLVLERSFTYPAQIFARMQEQKVTVFPGVPTIYAMLISSHGRTPLSFPHVTRVTNTAAALPDEFVVKLREIFPNTLIFKMYGLTECKRVSYLEPELAETKPASVGRAIPGTEIYLLSPDGKPVPPGETGILYVRGPHVMVGYWNRPDLSEHMLKAGKLPGERVLCTQDFFRMDADGFLYFQGRSDDIIKTRGEKVAPVEVENALHSISGVREAAVVGIPDPLLGEAIRAYVVVEPESNLNDKQLRVACASRLENFMVPKEFVFCAELPKTATGKVSKKLLIENSNAK
ncbi:MAG: class I adenylate-forming enzyme family protein [Pseudomonadota bacterium]